MFSSCQKSWEVVKNIKFLSVNMTCGSILVFEISARNVQFLPEILGSCQKHKVSFGKYAMSINSRFEISVRNVQFLPEVVGSGQKHKVPFGKYNMSINSHS